MIFTDKQIKNIEDYKIKVVKVERNGRDYLEFRNKKGTFKRVLYSRSKGKTIKEAKQQVKSVRKARETEELKQELLQDEAVKVVSWVVESVNKSKGSRAYGELRATYTNEFDGLSDLTIMQELFKILKKHDQAGASMWEDFKNHFKTKNMSVNKGVETGISTREFSVYIDYAGAFEYENDFSY